MKKFTCFLLSIVAFQAFSSGTIDFLEVDNDVVLFSTTQAKTHTLPSCVTAENANLWSVSLATESGRATYSLILTAMAKGDNVGLSIQSADDCGVKNGLERALNVSIQVISQQSEAGLSNRISVYKADGINRVGTLIQISDRGAWVILEKGMTKDYIMYYPKSGTNASVELRFESTDCSGQAYTNRRDSLVRNTNYMNGQFYMSGGIDSRLLNHPASSYLSAYGDCTAQSIDIDLYPLTEQHETDFCGNNTCFLKED
ncbi:hypothetical protein [Paraglaciecola sp.]|uniref:hypothetical protein n=1 Tax=Paraglaciecola sp. TaxID=1920173 RepID=UPI003EF993FB